MHRVHERGRSADVEPRRDGHAGRRHRVRADVADVVVVDTAPVVGIRRAVEDMPTSVRQRRKQRVGLVGERVLPAVPRAVDPPDVARVLARAQQRKSVERDAGEGRGEHVVDGELVARVGECAEVGTQVGGLTRADRTSRPRNQSG